MRIGEVAKQIGLPASTIRYYESKGLIDVQSRVSGRREFNAKAILILQFVRLAKSAGFSIDEMKALLDSYDADPSPAAMWATLARDKRRSVQDKIKDLQQVETILGKLLDCECASLSECVELALAAQGEHGPR